jgi:hypothetical protein
VQDWTKQQALIKRTGHVVNEGNLAFNRREIKRCLEIIRRFMTIIDGFEMLEAASLCVRKYALCFSKLDLVKELRRFCQ